MLPPRSVALLARETAGKVGLVREAEAVDLDVHVLESRMAAAAFGSGNGP